MVISFVVGPDIAVVSDKIGKVDIFIEERKRRVDVEMCAGTTAVPFHDDLRNYVYEGGGGSTSQGSLSSLPNLSGTYKSYH